METELERFLPLPQVDEDQREFVAVDVEENNISAESDGTKREVESTSAELVNSIKKNLSVYTSRDSSPVSIYKVPSKLRKVNEEAFTPRIISIGPIHHGKSELEHMQRYKWRFLDNYLRMISASLDQLATSAKDMENKVRQCYQESFDNIESKDFSEMILLDAIFIISLLNKNTEDEKNSTSRQVSRNPWVKSDIVHDLILLENQLPFFVLEHFCKYLEMTYIDLRESIACYFSGAGNMKKLKKRDKNARHLLDHLRSYYLPKQVLNRGKIVYCHSATELQEAGVKFEGVPRDDIFGISFVMGCLKIPTLRIDEHSEILFRNLIAFEQCQYEETKDITNYIIFMDSLINTRNDVDLLVDCGAIKNLLGDHELVANLFNNLHKEIVTPEKMYCFESICAELNDYSKNYWHQWKAKWFRSKRVLRRDYFNTPWSTISVIAAVILLVLTVVQTVCSIISIS